MKNTELSQKILNKLCEFLRSTDRALLNNQGDIIAILPATKC